MLKLITMKERKKMKNKHKIFIKEIIIFIVLTIIIVKFLVR